MVEHPLVAPLVEKVVGGMDSVMGLSKQMMLHLLIMASEPTALTALDKSQSGAR